jgi:hypothetical protein
MVLDSHTGGAIASIWNMGIAGQDMLNQDKSCINGEKALRPALDFAI